MKTFCPNCEKDTDCTHEAELYACNECGEDFAKYIVPRKPADSDVSMTQDVLTDIKTPQSIENTNPDYYKDELDFDSMPIEKINQYLQEHGYDPEKVGLRGKILVESLTKNIIAREIIQRFITDSGGCRFCDYGILRKPNDPLKGHDEECLYLAAHAYLDNETSTVVKRDLSDAEIEELGAQEAENKRKG